MTLTYPAPVAGGEAYGGGVSARGSKEAWAKLFPRSPGPGRQHKLGSITAGLPPCIDKVTAKYPNIISGHVINADYGGDGNQSYNQTCLTAKANSDHKFDNAIWDAWLSQTDALEAIRQLSDAGKPAQKSFLEGLTRNWCIKIRGVVDVTTWGPTKEEYCVFTGITYTSSVANQPKLDEISAILGVSAASLDRVKTFLDAVAKVDNIEYHVNNLQSDGGSQRPRTGPVHVRSRPS